MLQVSHCISILNNILRIEIVCDILFLQVCVPQGVKVSAQKLERNCRKAFFYCKAFVDVKNKKVTKATQQNDPFLKWPVSPTAVIELHEVFNHGLDCADQLRLLKPTSATSAAFFRYFQDDTTPAAALAPHKTKLARQADGEGLLASSAVNPPASTVYHWFCGCGEGSMATKETTPKKPAPAHPQGKTNRWQQSLNSSSCLWIPSHSWRPTAQMEAVTNQLAAADQQAQEEAPGRSLPMKAGFTSARRCGRTVKVQPTSIARHRPGVNRGPGRVPAGQELG
ncbi:hypothetical protein HPB48_002579 [Haemaphysalis longicornis]|uniref:Uncharacterized protein n=1 Tax=Haemaphysalis longicornis TaxID=44386 RepID=A0A9J6FAI3_HAELO|nr:hypothetical protein HPB48_002579 [Haemaphysalis longicornis]